MILTATLHGSMWETSVLVTGTVTVMGLLWQMNVSMDTEHFFEQYNWSVYRYLLTRNIHLVDIDGVGVVIH